VSHKTTVNLRDDLYVKVRAAAQRESLSVGEMVNRLIAKGLAVGQEGRFSSFGSGEGDADLGINAEKYLSDALR
jgi:hypothetical protein